MALSIAQVKAGTYVSYKGDPYRVESAQHTKLGRGGGILKAKFRNLLTGAITDESFRDSDRLDEANLYRQPVNFLYREGDKLHFMDNQTFDQLELPLALLGDKANWLKDGSTVEALYFDSRPIGINLPPKVDLLVTYSEPAVAGNTVSSVLKAAKLETGATVKVPMFVKEGDVIRISTESGEYVERVKQ